MLAEITAYQWGLVTSAQASRIGVTRLSLSRLTDAGHLERLAHGVYKDAGAPSDQFEDLRAAWLSTEPKATAAERLQGDLADDTVVAGASAARLHGIGDLAADQHEFVARVRRQSQRREIRYRLRVLDPRDVTLVAGLPTMTIERTIADLVETIGDLSLVADALRDASRERTLDLDCLRGYLAPLAQRNGLRRGDGAALLGRLMEIAGIDPEAVAYRIASDTSLGALVAERYFTMFTEDQIRRFVSSPAMQDMARSLQQATAEMLAQNVSPVLNHTAAAATEQVRAELLKNVGTSDLVRRMSEQLIDGEALKKAARAWSEAITSDVLLATIRDVRKPADDE